MADDDVDVDAFLADYKRRAESVPICKRQDLIAEHAQLEDELGTAATSGQHDDDGHVGRTREVLDRLEEIEAEIEASTVTWRIEAIPHKKWNKLVIEHPPSDEDRKRGGGVGASFWPPAVAACCAEPTVTVEQAEQLPEVLASADWARLCAAAQRCNEEAGAAPKSPMAGAVRAALDASSKPRTASRGKSGTAAKGARSRSTTTTKKAG